MEVTNTWCEVPHCCNRKRKGRCGGCNPKASIETISKHSENDGGSSILTECSLSKGEEAKKLYDVVQMRLRTCKRHPNIVCRVEAFGKVCEKFDDRRKRWVVEMGFAGLLNLVGVSLPRTLCYWLMTRVNPLKETIVLNDGLEYSLTSNQVRWVLGLPLGGKIIPRRSVDEAMMVKEKSILDKYGMQRHGVIKRTGKEIRSKGVTLSHSTLERLKGYWSEEEEEEFKTSFLLMSLYLVLCPTQSVCLESDLISAVTLASNAQEYDWCSLVIEKLMGSVSRFLKKFDAHGFAAGCGGCSLFVALFYLDRLDRKPVQWGIWPRAKAWNNEEIRKGCRDDRLCPGGDFGKLRSIMASYGDIHPMDIGDKHYYILNLIQHSITVALCSINVALDLMQRSWDRHCCFRCLRSNATVKVA